MATVTVSSSSGLLSDPQERRSEHHDRADQRDLHASARGGQDFHGAVVTAARGADVTFSRINLNDISNLDFQGVEFRPAVGNGKAFVIAASHDITIRDVDILGRNNATATAPAMASGSRRLTASLWRTARSPTSRPASRFRRSPTSRSAATPCSNISLDGMIVGGVHNAYFYENTINLHVPHGAKHTDGMQFYNSGKNDPSSDFAYPRQRHQDPQQGEPQHLPRQWHRRRHRQTFAASTRTS